MTSLLQPAYNATSADYEIGVDEAGRGPMLGRVYAAAVILPKDPTLFRHDWMKDSKKFHSEKKIKEMAQYIKENAIAWAVGFEDELVIDEINIRQATFRAMHTAIKEVMLARPTVPYHILVDGNDFKMVTVITAREDSSSPYIVAVPHTCIEGGDNTYSSIAAASILAKVARDTYIEELCAANPILVTRYDLLKNKGYGTRKHMAGIHEYGITPYHRKTFGLCKTFTT
jgi:ribonuclease HII